MDTHTTRMFAVRGIAGQADAARKIASIMEEIRTANPEDATYHAASAAALCAALNGQVQVYLSILAGVGKQE